jgi:phosphopantetheine adenylyltransferase
MQISRQNGWIALPRDIQKHWIWTDAKRLKMWLHLVFNAKWEDSLIIVGNNQIELKRGQIVVSTRELMRQWGCCCDMATAFLRTLEKSGMIERVNRKQYSLVSIVDYDIYQPSTESLFASIKTVQKRDKAVHKAVQTKEKNNLDEQKKINSNIFSAENENNIFNRIIKNDETIKKLSIVAKCQPEKILEELTIFLNHITLQEKGHKDSNDFVTHFTNWHNRRQQNDNSTSWHTNNGNIQRQDSRRGTEISNRPDKDYKNDAF